MIEKKRGIWFSIHLIVIGVQFHWCKHCSMLAIDILNTQFFWDFTKTVKMSEEEKLKQEEIMENLQKVRMPTQEEMLFMTFDQSMNKHGFFMFTTYDEDNPNKIHKWINEKEQIISINFGGAINVIKSETFLDFINSKLNKPENV